MKPDINKARMNVLKEQGIRATHRARESWPEVEYESRMERGLDAGENAERVGAMVRSLAAGYGIFHDSVLTLEEVPDWSEAHPPMLVMRVVNRIPEAFREDLDRLEQLMGIEADLADARAEIEKLEHDLVNARTVASSFQQIATMARENLEGERNAYCALEARRDLYQQQADQWKWAWAATTVLLVLACVLGGLVKAGVL